jgi:hypothetical protein
MKTSKLTPILRPSLSRWMRAPVHPAIGFTAAPGEVRLVGATSDLYAREDV